MRRHSLSDHRRRSSWCSTARWEGMLCRPESSRSTTFASCSRTSLVAKTTSPEHAPQAKLNISHSTSGDSYPLRLALCHAGLSFSSWLFRSVASISTFCFRLLDGVDSLGSSSLMVVSTWEAFFRRVVVFALCERGAGCEAANPVDDHVKSLCEQYFRLLCFVCRIG